MRFGKMSKRLGRVLRTSLVKTVGSAMTYVEAVGNGQPTPEKTSGKCQVEGTAYIIDVLFESVCSLSCRCNDLQEELRRVSTASSESCNALEDEPKKLAPERSADSATASDSQLDLQPCLKKQKGGSSSATYTLPRLNAWPTHGRKCGHCRVSWLPNIEVTISPWTV